MPKKKRRPRSGSIPEPHVPIQVTPHERDFGLRLTRIRPGGGRERVQLTWNVPSDAYSALIGLEGLRFGDTVGRLEDEIVEELRASGVPWAGIGRALGITAEGARVRFAHLAS